MGSVQEIGEILEIFRKKYNKNPESWKVFYSRGNSGVLIGIYNTRKKEGWIVYFEPHRSFGMEIGKIEEVEKLETLTDFGYRILPERLAKKILKEIYEYEAIAQKTISELLKFETVEEERVKEEKAFVLGPKHFVKNFTSYFERKILEELMKKAEEEWRKEYYYIG